MRNRIVLLAVSAALIASASAGNPVVVMATNQGEIRIELDREKAPVTVANFLRYVEEKHYSGAIFHRAVPGFVIQGGGYRLPGDGDDEGVAAVELSTRAPILNEAKASGLKNLRGTIAMARVHKDPNSATAQFFINVVDNSRRLDAGGASGPAGWAVFGKVTEGLDVIDRIGKVKTHPAMFKQLKKPKPIELRNAPVEPVVIESVKIIAGSGKPDASENLRPDEFSGGELSEEIMSSLGIDPSSGASKELFKFYESAGGMMMVDIDLGDGGTKQPIVIESSKDLITWSPMPGLEQLPKGTRGVKTVLIPDGTSRLFLRLVKAAPE